jgi:hypothetical protein
MPLHSTCYRPGCDNERLPECGFCPEHAREMRTPKAQERRTEQQDYTHCPCGAPATRELLCDDCYTQKRRRIFR